MSLQILIVAACAVCIVYAVRLLVVPGIERICTAWGLSSKVKGQILGYATSLPELAVVVAAAYSGVFDAGLWNIIASNLINCALFASAIVAYRKQMDLQHRHFRDELVFVLISVAAPAGLHVAGVDVDLRSAAFLILLFVVYRWLDVRLNAGTAGAQTLSKCPRGGGFLGALRLLAGVVVVVAAGRMLGASSATLIEQLGTPAWLVGWILGGITSIPEMASFWEVFRLGKLRGWADCVADTQEALDALIASNMCNMGIILPAGCLVYAWMT